ncbi:putative thymidylate synthase [Idiomarinaceae phage 1N2-2]|uniref:putative thymidylate synthase n=1 Tax=Idiomarinaceae phage 1N2-2 TaxID=1536592 RepID=UPI0004F77944|nr:putative thymidylate synthase [Idiomarinaceae phage 1N2-2]AIM40745.1 putative thymidylate synthase [Idiomarinaceae phage 1N2-2]
MKIQHIQASRNRHTGDVIHTLVLEYPRAIHSQLLTHRVFSKNSSSTRAVPIRAAVQNVLDNPAQPIWTHNQAGMQGERVTDPVLIAQANAIHEAHMQSAIATAKMLGLKPEEGGLGIHKQNAGRYLEPFQNIRVCLTSTEWENWDWLRVDADAQPEITELANAIKAARDNAEPLEIGAGEYHVPFVERERDADGRLRYYSESREVSLADAINISMSCAAQTSYRRLDVTLEKADDIIGKLFNGRKVHASPSEHPATPIQHCGDAPWPGGVTHMNREGVLWSGNFRGFIQHRQLLPNHDGAKL